MDIARRVFAFLAFLALLLASAGVAVAADSSADRPTGWHAVTDPEAHDHDEVRSESIGCAAADEPPTDTIRWRLAFAAEDPVKTRACVAANSVDDLGRVLSHADLNPAQLSNFTRYTKKLPAGAEPTVITRGAEGTVQLSTKVPGRVPGSYATYDKVVDASGTTIGYTKKTVLPDGTILHTKDKLNP